MTTARRFFYALALVAAWAMGTHTPAGASWSILGTIWLFGSATMTMGFLLGRAMLWAEREEQYLEVQRRDRAGA